ncbi:AbrB/MazE/SpoVT family DNA-binding domain-containing protein [Klebsiella pneumoniae]|uniref:AbrB/MazE/SpoVT family DNA-binding domain-containing protein n=1 Tax=Klebsiella pneumoniae TaxID=573 RepID=A0A927DP80_KLEPN|nr:AbrB/MazE/SpoVT family DNA-binding domain-containing protein [Klebsiella pneumoniae]MBD3715579.1 AbrB/MazE/SpoVT family DNA-binding domain-containing protein [Klebsiella pneumoniae]MBD3721851.1 AbrB/MazE/SpoVT family DNA-binding domain-containing protein [Klebsiella pneumoniae]
MSFRPQPEPTPTLPDVFLKTIRLPRDLDFEGVSELKIVREGTVSSCVPSGRPRCSFAQLEKAEPDFMVERGDVVSDEGRFDL